MPSTTLAPLPDSARPPGRARRALAVLVALVLGIGAPLAVVAPAHADTIATVDFDDLSGWTVNFWSATGGNAVAGRGPSGSGSISTTANFSGFENIEVSIRYRVENLPAGHAFFFNYNPGGSPFTPLNRTTNTAGFVTESYPLNASVNNDSSVTLNFGNVTPGPDPMPIIEVDSMTITGDPIDTTDPTITVVGPLDGSTIPIPASTDYEVEVADNVTAAGDIDVEYSFHHDGDSFTETPTVGVGGARSATIAPNIFDFQFGLVQGEVFEWRITATDDESNVATTSVFLVFGDPEGPELPVTSLDDGVRGTAYSMAISSFGTPPITFAALNLPDGLTINASTGLISGTPTEAGTFSVTITATNDVDSDDVTLDLFIADPPTITTTTLADGLVGAAYTATIAATGDPTLVYTATGLPSGITLDPGTGELSGTPTASGSYSPEFTVTNDAGSDVETITIEIDSAPTITSGAPPSGVVGTAYSHTVTADGHPAPTFSVSGTLPPGLSLDPTSGLLDGAPTTEGSFTFTVTATNGVGADDAEEYTVVIEPAPAAPAFTSGMPGDGVVGVPYVFVLTASGYPAATFSVGAGSLPPGLELDPVSGEISGTPTLAGSFSLTLVASNGVGGAANLPVTIEVDEAPTITSGAPPSGVVGAAYSHTVTVDGSPAPTFSVSGTLPPGLGLDPTSGLIDGAPTTEGSFTFTITATNGVGADDAEEYTVVIEPAPAAPAFTSGMPGDGVVGVAYSFLLTASGYPAATFSVGAGTLPPGLELDGTSGAITGTPTMAGSFDLTLVATNGVGSPATLPVTIEVLAAPEIGPALPPTATVGEPFSFVVPTTGTAPFTFSIAFGVLPDGLELDETTGEIAGTPTASVTSLVLVEVTNATGIDDSVEYVFVVSAAAVPEVESEGESSDLTDTLPNTGADPAGMVALALALIALGALVRLARRIA